MKFAHTSCRHWIAEGGGWSHTLRAYLCSGNNQQLWILSKKRKCSWIVHSHHEVGAGKTTTPQTLFASAGGPCLSLCCCDKPGMRWGSQQIKYGLSLCLLRAFLLNWQTNRIVLVRSPALFACSFKGQGRKASQTPQCCFVVKTVTFHRSGVANLRRLKICTKWRFSFSLSLKKILGSRSCAHTCSLTQVEKEWRCLL